MGKFIVRAVEDGERAYVIHVGIAHNSTWTDFINWFNTLPDESIIADFPRFYITLTIEEEQVMNEKFGRCVAQTYEDYKNSLA